MILAGMAFHFAGILSAITSPPPTPPVTDQYWRRVAREYLMFAYMNNAYQFYSPDPGPACELWVCFEYDTGNADPKLIRTPDDTMTQSEWLHMAMISMLLRGNVYGLIRRDDYQRYAVEARRYFSGQVVVAEDLMQF